MSTEVQRPAASRLVQIALLVVSGTLVLYAVSDHPFYGGEPGFGATQMMMAAFGIGLALCGLLLTRNSGPILLLAIASIVALVLAEFAGEFVLGPRHRPIYQYDDQLIFKFIPGRTSMMRHPPVNGGGVVIHRINSTGFRGDELRPTGAATRVVVYGDSMIHAFYSPQEETFAARLGALFSVRLGRDVEVVNAGVSSYGPDQISLKMEQELPWLRPDLAVVAILADNDYGDLLRNRLFRLGADGELVKNAWTLDPDVRFAFDLSQRESILKRALRDATAHLRSSPDNDRRPGKAGRASDADIVKFLLEEAEREYTNFVVEGNNTVTNTHQDYYDADVSLVPGRASARYKVAMMGAVVRRIRDIAAHNDVPLVFLFIPHPSDVSDRYDWVQFDRKQFPEYDSRNLITPLESAARELGVHFVSLYDVYRAHDANSLYLHGGDQHWNAAGQRLAAEVMTDYLLARGLPGRARGSANPP